MVVADPLQKVDALVILAGNENERIAAGAQLFQEGYADWFVLTDMRLDIPNSSGIYSANVKRKAVERGVAEQRILISSGQVSTTGEEVTRLRDFTLSKGFRSLIVITSPFHTRRARMLLHEAFRGSGVTVIVRPAMNYVYHAETWWRNPADRALTELEYAKIFAHWLGCLDNSSCGPLPWEWLRTWQKFLQHE